MQKIKLKRKTDGEEVECIIKILNKDDLDDVLKLEKIIIKALPEQSLFQGDTKESIFNYLDKEGIACGVIHKKELIACGAMHFPKKNKDNLGLDIGLEEEELDHVAHIEINIVHPEYRGNGLQILLNEMLIEKAKEKGFFHILATVSPHNKVSHSNIEQLGLKTVTTKIKFGDKLRDIMYMKI